MKTRLFAFSFLLFSFLSTAQNGSDINTTVRIEAEVDADQPKISLSWVEDPNVTQYQIYRKSVEEISWGVRIAEGDGSMTSYEDIDIQKGERYEYRVLKSGSGFTGYGYITAGIEVGPKHDNGSILVLVEEEAKDSITANLNRYTNILRSECWNVMLEYVSRDSSVAFTKSIVQTAYSKVADLNDMVILGHVPVPHSGNIVPDGHNNHVGAWSADVFYGDLDGNWTDATVTNESSGNAKNHNVPGDGKLDQNRIPSEVEIAVGRVDFSDLPAFDQSEYALLNRYLEKNIEFRTGKYTPSPKAVVEENFNRPEAFAQSALRSFSTMVGNDSISYGDFDEAFESDHLFAYGAGGGSYTSAGGIANSGRFASEPLMSTFTMLFGSYFGDYNSRNNFMRSALASGTALSCSWAGRPHWFYHSMGLGNTLGDCTRATQNNVGTYVPNTFNRFVHVNLLGDPSLSAFRVQAPSNLVATEEDDHILLEWRESEDDVVGYFLYRRMVGNDRFALVQTDMITDLSYRDDCVVQGVTYEYLVRACELRSTPSGSYYNLSGGPTYQITPTIDNAVVAAFDLIIEDGKVISTNTSINADEYLWTLPDGTTSDSSEICYIPDEFEELVFELTASNGCFEDQVTGSILYSSIHELGEDDFSFYPNPTSGIINYEPLSSGTRLEILNETGYRLGIDVNPRLGTIDLSTLPAGIYYLRIFDAQSTFLKKVIKI